MSIKRRKPVTPETRRTGWQINQNLLNRQDNNSKIQNECNPDLASYIKSYLVDLLAERYFYGADSLQHRCVALFWERFGGRYLNV